MATETITQTPTSFAVAVEAKKSRRDVHTTFNYYKDPCDGTPPMPVYVGGNTVTNERPIAPTEVVVRDITGEEDLYKLDSHGFELVQHESSGFAAKEGDEEEGKKGKCLFDNEDWVKKVYYRECEEVYKKATGAHTIYIFSHLLRRGPTHWHALGSGNASKKGPLHRVHIDQSTLGAEIILRKQFPSTYSSILTSGRRWSIINLWRPLRTIYKDPLALGSSSSFPEQDLVEASVIYTQSKEEYPLDRNLTWTVRAGEGHEWFYRNEMGRREVWLIKCFDSEGREGVARRAPHCAFVDREREGEGWGDRESVEVRAVCVWD
ncbi:hypothetical protein P154DRAFT_502853 [Amniculicola lignicola CBS 123094]|uniref:Uncharacterized protein n=1 Tax=Amniculicola lignicola CBS 123094 TaxID=1392246 RepID=A0A6A5W0U5_9PLEO|nr:hypothetical protein P154DRAFT_502853 [Amniculicola lignicola CBS 123094]